MAPNGIHMALPNGHKQLKKLMPPALPLISANGKGHVPARRSDDAVMHNQTKADSLPEIATTGTLSGAEVSLDGNPVTFLKIGSPRANASELPVAEQVSEQSSLEVQQISDHTDGATDSRDDRTNGLQHTSELETSAPSERSNTEASTQATSFNCNDNQATAAKEIFSDDLRQDVDYGLETIHNFARNDANHAQPRPMPPANGAPPMIYRLQSSTNTNSHSHTNSVASMVSAPQFPHPGYYLGPQPPVTTQNEIAGHPELHVSESALPNHESSFGSIHHRVQSHQVQPPTIHNHLLELVNSKQYADWTLHIERPSPSTSSFPVYAHGALLVRSARMRRLIDLALGSPRPTNFIRIFAGRDIQPHAFEAALRFLYTDTILSAEAIFPQNTYMDRHARMHMVDYILSYWVAGIELGVKPVSARAFLLLTGTLDWDIVELLFKEATMLKNFATSIQDYRAVPEYMAAAGAILRLTLDFILSRLDVAQFQLDVTFGGDSTILRLGQLEASRAASNPALANVVFGSMPVSAEDSPITPLEKPSFSTDTVVSSILLNLDFHDLYNFSHNLISAHGVQGHRVMSDVIAEREARRLNVLNDRSISNKQRNALASVWEIIGWREFLKNKELQRERVSFTLPTGRRNKARQHVEQV